VASYKGSLILAYFPTRFALGLGLVCLHSYAYIYPRYGRPEKMVYEDGVHDYEME